MPRPAQSIAVAFALTLAAAPALAATAPPSLTKSREATPQADRREQQANRIPEPRAPQRLPLNLRRAEGEIRQRADDGPVPAKDAWFDDAGLRFNAGGLAYTVKF